MSNELKPSVWYSWLDVSSNACCRADGSWQYTRRIFADQGRQSIAKGHLALAGGQ